MSPAIDHERQKWDDYYARLPLGVEDPEAEIFYRDLAQVIMGMVPGDARVLEAGCGSGMHSLAIAKLRRCEVTLLDFSPDAINYARRAFDRAGMQANFEIGDVFAAQGAPDHDLVFNSGVLEHYEFARQVKFLNGMKQRSRRYVFVLVPNRECYWYWVWRVQQAAAGRWPFGYEKPASEYRAAIEAAGLHYLGKAYFGAAAVLRFLATLEGLSPELRKTVEGIHATGIVPEAQRSYLVGFLAAIDPGQGVPSGFAADGMDTVVMGADLADRYIALLGDALAAQIAAEHRLSAKERQLAEAAQRQESLDIQCRKLAAQLAVSRDGAAAHASLREVLTSMSARLAAPVRILGRLFKRPR